MRISRVRGVVVGVIAALVAGLHAVPAAAASPAVIPWEKGDPTFEAPASKPDVLGVNYQGTWNIMSRSERAKVLDTLAASGVEWVRLDIGWRSIQPDGPNSYSAGDIAEIDKQVTEIRSRGIKVLAIFGYAPKWASGTHDRSGRPKDPDDFANAAAWLADRYDGSISSDLRIDAIELWNEPNLGAYWNPSPSSTRVSAFATMIKKAGRAIKKVNSKITVVAGGVSAVDTDWYEEFYKTPGVIGTYDALGVHPYQSPGDASPETYDPKWGKYYLRHVTALDSLMTSKGDPATIWATEYGWSTHSNTSSTPGWARGVSEGEQADYLIRSLPALRSSSRVEAAFWYSAITTSTGDAHFDNYGLLRRDLGRKPAMYALKCAATGVCGPSGSSSSSIQPGDAVVRKGATWRFNDSGQDLGTSWRGNSYDDSWWSSGVGQFGYGDGDERTILSYGSNSWDKHPTYYFRTTFDAGQDVSFISGLRLEALVDDAAVVYLNGQEIWRFNLPSGGVSYSTLAERYVAGSEESKWRAVGVPASALKKGKNVIAVEAHQDSRTSSDVSMHLKLSVE